jgi:SOS-response transcriptional repressor LexA
MTETKMSWIVTKMLALRGEIAMSELSSILKTMMGQVKITVTELARQTGIGQPVIHRMASGETDNPKVLSLRPIAQFFDLNLSQLVGDEPLPRDRIPGTHNPFYRRWSRLPLLSWEQAIHWPELKLPQETVSYIATEAAVSENAFAVRMEDNTMNPRFAKDTILVIEPSLTAQDNDFALVYVKGDPKTQFKQVLFDGTSLYLKPLNPDFEVKHVTEEYRILGVMVQALTEFYQDRLRHQMNVQALENASTTSPVKHCREKISEASEEAISEEVLHTTTEETS